MKFAIVLGTRPEIIKLAPIVFELERRKLSYFIIHTGQHYSENMDRVFWDLLDIPQPKYQLGVREPTHAKQTSEMLKLIDGILQLEKPNWVIVQGDTNSTLAGALTASKQKGIRVAHLEAGLRSFDRQMPEEINRVIVDHLSDVLLAPTNEAVSFLKKEGIQEHRIYQVGNTVEDMLVRFLKTAEEKSHIHRGLKINSGEYILLTIHRQENTDSIVRLMGILDSVIQISAEKNLQVVFPAHPRTRQVLEKMNYRFLSNVIVIDPVGYFDFLMLQKKARLVATDSGGVQEETCLMQVPCITLRENTERPETVRIGANILVGVDPLEIKAGFLQQWSQLGSKNWSSPYGGGAAAEQSISILLSL